MRDDPYDSPADTLRALNDQLRSDHRRATERAESAERERDRLRQQLRAATYGGPVNAKLHGWHEALELIDRIDVDALAVSIGQARDHHLRATSYDGAGRPAVLYCELHEGDLSDCPEHDLCTGVPVDSRTDRTGDTAAKVADKGDRASQDLGRLRAAQFQLVKVARTLAALHDRYSIRPANAYQRTTNVNIPGCKSCARLPVTLQDGTKQQRWEPIHPGLTVCQWCYRWELKTGAPPTIAQLQAHHEGKRVMVKEAS